MAELIDTAGKVPARTCQGVLLADGRGEPMIVTAAHCVSAGRSGAGSLLVRQAGRERAVLETLSHPRFRGDLPGPLYDVAVLRVGGLERGPIKRLQAEPPDVRVGASVRLSTFETGVLRWIQGTVQRVRPLDIEIGVPGLSQCRGLSGAPVILEAARGDVLLGTVSSGARTCGGTLSVATLWSARELLGAPDGPTCRECLDEMSSIDRGCSAPSRACERHDECRAGLECMLGCDDAPCRQRCVGAPGVGSELLSELIRCTVRRGCQEHCPEFRESESGCGLHPADPGCRSCMVAKCCEVSRSCAEDASCRACADGARSPGCLSQRAYATLDACLRDTCAQTCR